MDFEQDPTFGLSMRDDIPVLSAGAGGLWQGLQDSWVNREHVTWLVTNASLQDLADAIGSEARIVERKRVLRQLSSNVTPAALLLLIEATALAYNRPLSAPLEALLQKLAREATELPEAVRLLADRTFRNLFRDMVEAWSGQTLDTTSTGYETLFSHTTSDPIGTAESVAPEPERVVEMAFESGATGNVLWSALQRVGESEAGVRRILNMVKQAPRDSRAARVVAHQFANPVRLRMLFREDPVDFEAVDSLLEHMGTQAATPLLDALVEGRSRATRRGLLERLSALGPAIGPMVSDRLLADDRWFVVRNMLTLLREANCSLELVPLDRYAKHTDVRVRREATQLMFLKPTEREHALLSALRDTDSGMLKVGLKAARAVMPESVIPLLAKRVVDPEFPPEFRTSALQLLSRSTSILALEALLRFAMGGTTLLGKPKLAPKSPEMLISLSGLARSWPKERRAAALLALARESKDQDIARAAVLGQRGPFADDKDELDDE